MTRPPDFEVDIVRAQGSCAREDRVIESHTKLRHLPFFDAVAAREPESDAGLALRAGLVTLRLVDAWLEGDEDAANPLGRNIRSVREAIGCVDERKTQHALLDRIVEALSGKQPDIRAVHPPLKAYAQALEYDAMWLLAADVYHTVLAHLHPIEDSDASIVAHQRLGSCYRNLHRLDHAAAAYAAAAEIGSSVGDLVGVLRARIGEASLASLRGNLPEAATILDDAVARAVGEDFAEVRATALGERSSVAILGGQYELGIRMAYAALGQMKSPTDRDRVLNNIAHAFASLGVYSAARDAYLVLSVTAQEQYMRWAATISLLDVASMTGSQVLFETYRRELGVAPLQPHLNTAFELALGQGYQRLGEHGKSHEHLEHALALAIEHNLNQFVIEAEGSLAALDAPTPPRGVEAIASLDVEEVALAIREMREAVGVS